jgi:hypothetical protein
MASPSAFVEEVAALELAIERFIPTLIPVHQLDTTLPGDKYILIAAHTLAHTALVHLYRRFARDDPICYEKSLRSARAVVGIIEQLVESDYGFLDPILGPCWTCVAETLIQELDSIESTWPLLNSADVRSELTAMLYAMTSLGVRFPITRLCLSSLHGV